MAYKSHILNTGFISIGRHSLVLLSVFKRLGNKYQIYDKDEFLNSI